MFIYKFTHIVTGKCYIGQTIQDPNVRRLEHISASRNPQKGYHLHSAIRKYGIDSFIFEVLDQANTLDELNTLEEMYAIKYDVYQNGFNIRQAGGNKLHSEESKKRMSQAQRDAHARRREQNSGIEKHKEPSHKGKKNQWVLNEEQKQKKKDIMKEVNRRTSGGKTWKVIDGKRVWLNKEAAV
jgi:group I intron endonuclease